MRNRGLVVSSKGDITATFSVPGLMTIPSDGASHNVTITQLELEAVMSWISVPKKSPKAHLTVCSHHCVMISFFGQLIPIIHRRKLRMNPNTHSSAALPVFTSTGASSRARMSPLSARKKASTAHSGE